MKDIIVPLLAILGGLVLILYSRWFARKAVTQNNIFGRANATAGEKSVRMGPLLIGGFLVIVGLLIPLGVIQPD
ncbi:hypothetical protein V1J52_11065 [Streptomyces sp. TRM 70351]|uniref:hypothetical protein n=1 Tax=Streptomyces sp. TRM 70351 TaxID=3116552 RepID=UPI002E7B4B70|nr:hypothetical protein [Streptomyces sp. TRM 70351]MEE1928729.1 hypothetical protein [Streptomyces sp. TRM 70351]